jgi:RimJ/RimL family protein N-acetyltransferase
MIGYSYAGPVTDPVFNKVVGDFVSRGIFGEPGKIDGYCSMAVIDKDKLIAGVLYNNYHPDVGVIELHTAAFDKRWLTRPILRGIFSLPFDRLGCQLCVIRVSERNETMLRIARSVGFKDVLIPRLRGRDEGEYIMTLTDDDWRQSRFCKGMN